MKKSLFHIIALFTIISIVVFLFNYTYPATKSIIIESNEIQFSRVINLNGVDYCNGDLCLGSFSIFAIANDSNLDGYLYTNQEKEIFSTDKGFGPILMIRNNTLIEVGYIHGIVTLKQGFTEEQCDIVSYLALSYGVKAPECHDVNEIIEWYYK